jgi:histidine ammonia-lyase
MLLLKIQSLGYGHSGIQLQTVNRLVAFFNNDILPVIYTQGSLASGDLAVSTSIFALTRRRRSLF